MTSENSRLPPLARSLSARLLVLTIFFVMLAEVFIFAPSIARFRLNWMEEKIAAAHLATLALEATPDHMVSKELERELLRHVGGHGVILQKPGSKELVLSSDMPPRIDASIDITKSTFMGLIADAFAVLFRTRDRVLRVMGPSPRDKDVIVEVVLNERPLRALMFAYGERIMILSIGISVFTAFLVYLSLHWLMVVPMRRITSSMVAFRERPNDPSSAVAVSRRGDEIGTAERELATMQTRLRGALRQRQHLAALGEAVAKINHDLRNVLSTAQLVSARLEGSEDPQVQKATPTLVRSLDRAVILCTETLNYAQEPGDLSAARFALAPMLEEIPTAVPLIADGKVRLVVEVPQDVEVTGDREQLFRAFANLAKNAAEAGAETVTVALAGTAPVAVEVRDDGPGLPSKALENLFTPFAGSVRSGGTGLGLAIAREVMEAHGGNVELTATGPEGTVFRIEMGRLPAGAREAAQ